MKIIKSTKKNPRLIYGGYCKIKEKNDYINSSIPKVVVSKNEDLMYMSRVVYRQIRKKNLFKVLGKYVYIPFQKNLSKYFYHLKKRVF